MFLYPSRYSFALCRGCRFQFRRCRFPMLPIALLLCCKLWFVCRICRRFVLRNPCRKQRRFLPAGPVVLHRDNPMSGRWGIRSCIRLRRVWHWYCNRNYPMFHNP